ncbi:MAG: AAC(3) family N-acetyltransferase [Bauldia sp.]|nr:AAC(3) family N-acetyltransferase [Bauldia sp.]
MPVSRADLIADLRRLGVAPGQSVMIHASVRAIGPVFGGPDQIHLAVADAVGPEGGVLMYLSVPDGMDDIGRGVFPAEEEVAMRQNMPPFDPATARAARDHGVLAEFFRTWPGTIITPHPTRFGARGGKASALLADQPWDFALGAGSPLDHLCADGGKVLLLGSDHDAVTLLHYAEHIADFPDKIITRFEVPMLRDGERVWMPCLEVDSNRAHASWPDRFFATIVDRFVEARVGAGEAKVGRVGGAECVLLDAAALVAFAVPIMEAQAKSQGV